MESGTRVHCVGLVERTSARNSGNGLPSMLSSAPGRSLTSAARSRTSAGRACRSSGRGCRVTPPAPASRQRLAAWTTLGECPSRAFLTRAILFRLTLKIVIGVPSLGCRQFGEQLGAPRPGLLESDLEVRKVANEE